MKKSIFKALASLSLLSLSLALVNAPSAQADDSWQFTYANENAVPQSGDFNELENYLTNHPEIVTEIKRAGVLRLVVDKNHTEKMTEIETQATWVLKSLNLNKKIEIILVPVDMEKVKTEAVEEVIAESATPMSEETLLALQNEELPASEPTETRFKHTLKKIFRTLVVVPAHVLVFPFEQIYKQTKYLGKTAISSYVKPTKSEVIGGVISKSYPFSVSAAQFAMAYANHPLQLVTSVSMSLALDSFHGVWVSTWLNLQNRLNKEKGGTYQIVFNYLYGQFWGMAFRAISYSSGTSKESPVSREFLIISNTTGAATEFFNSLAYQGLNRLLSKGIYSYKKRAFLQQFLRDVPYMIQQTQLYIGGEANMKIFWFLWGFNQVQSLYYYLRSELSAYRPTLFIGPKEVLASTSFQEMFPETMQTTPIKHKKFLELIAAPFKRLFSSGTQKSAACGGTFTGPDQE